MLKFPFPFEKSKITSSTKLVVFSTHLITSHTTRMFCFQTYREYLSTSNSIQKKPYQSLIFLLYCTNENNNITSFKLPLFSFTRLHHFIFPIHIISYVIKGLHEIAISIDRSRTKSRRRVCCT